MKRKKEKGDENERTRIEEEDKVENNDKEEEKIEEEENEDENEVRKDLLNDVIGAKYLQVEKSVYFIFFMMEDCFYYNNFTTVLKICRFTAGTIRFLWSALVVSRSL